MKENETSKREVKIFQTRQQKRVNALLLALLTFVCQLILLVEIFLQLVVGERDKLREMLNIGLIIFARFICATILHLSLTEEINNSLLCMKYVNNHSYNFQAPRIAFFISFMHYLITNITELVNICIIITSIYPVAIVLNFIAIAIIAEFDNYVYTSMRNEYCKKLITKNIAEKILVVHHTTSKRCGENELSNVKDENGDFRKLKIRFQERNCGGKLAYMIYKVCRVYFVSVYFYFLPFTSVMLSILIPLLTNDENLPHEETI